MYLLNVKGIKAEQEGEILSEHLLRQPRAPLLISPLYEAAGPLGWSCFGSTMEMLLPKPRWAPSLPSPHTLLPGYIDSSRLLLFPAFCRALVHAAGAVPVQGEPSALWAHPSSGHSRLGWRVCTAQIYSFAFTTVISSSVKTQLLRGMGLNHPQKSWFLLNHVLDTSPSPALLSAWLEGESC